MSLDLGPILFSANRTPNTRPGSRLRGGTAVAAARPHAGLPERAGSKGSKQLNRSDPRVGFGESGESISRAAQLSITPDTVGPKDVEFLLGASQERMGRSFAASLGGHVIVIGLVLFVISLGPDRVFELVEPNRENFGIVWLPEEGPGGGGGGGGNESLELPRQVELQGADDAELSVPVAPEPEFVEPEIREETLQTQLLNIPAVSIAGAPQTAPGVLEGFSARATLSQGSGTGGGGGTGEGTGVGPGTGPGLGPGEGGGVGGGVYRPGAGIVNPKVLHEVKPQYTSEAMRAQIQGDVWLEVVVLPDGTVGDVTVTKSLDPVFGLDEEAIKAARQWRFVPATRFGEPVAILVSLELGFNLR